MNFTAIVPGLILILVLLANRIGPPPCQEGGQGKDSGKVRTSKLLIGKWQLSDRGDLQMEFLDSKVARIISKNKLAYSAKYVVLDTTGATEVGLIDVRDSKGNFREFQRFTGAEADVLFKVTVTSNRLTVSRPTYPEWSLMIGRVRIPPPQGEKLEFIRRTEK